MSDLTPAPQFEPTAPFLANFIEKFRLLLLEPTKFFKALPHEEPLSQSLGFAILIHWIGSALVFGTTFLVADGTNLEELVRSLPNSGAERAMFDKLLPLLQNSKTFFAGNLILDPFWTLLGLLFSSFITFLGASLFVPRTSAERPSFASTLRITAYALSPVSIFAFIPFGIGWVIGEFWGFVLKMTGFRERYDLTPTRAGIIALFPSLLFLGILFIGTLIMVTFFATFLSNLF